MGSSEERHKRKHHKQEKSRHRSRS